VDAKTGEVHWTSELETRSKFEASPTIADGKIYMMNHAGEVFVAAASPEQFTLLHRAEMGEGRNQENRSSVAIAGGNLFIRTDDTLFCVGE
ncbi:MAG: PQQ-binding-like beta-propeller repeat protein, partial [Verrucomicrobiota bacterium]